MAGCRERTKKFVRKSWSILGPTLAPHLFAAVGLVDELANGLPDLIGPHEKRKAVIASVMGKAKEIGHAAFDDTKKLTIGQLENATRAGIENAVFHLREGAEAWAELADTTDLVDDDTVLVE